jgi:hypothetical protein
VTQFQQRYGGDFLKYTYSAARWVLTGIPPL